MEEAEPARGLSALAKVRRQYGPAGAPTLPGRLRFNRGSQPRANVAAQPRANNDRLKALSRIQITAIQAMASDPIPMTTRGYHARREAR